jgi:hypothetical protein
MYIGREGGRGHNLNYLLTFRGPYIVIYSYNKSQQDALFLKFILIKNSTCFGQIYCPSSGVSTLYTAIGICQAEILKVGNITSVI